MAQLPSSYAPYSYSGRTRILENDVTVLPYVSSADPEVVDATPTILRCFYDDPPNVKAEHSSTEAGGRPGFANAAPVVTSTSGSAASTTAASTASTSISVASTTVTQKAKNNRHDPPEEFDEDGSRTIRARLGCHPNRHEMKTGQ
ncbi:hypothetical protein L226DRAFT_527769, partial [Lentinus tigrinus ALCF2SS1-7]|uniref:uncharacterized protein n=1 Tax=Lentinus tigrinus ALCF2SS1-7 TaxID=1328758 RepID=UPI001165FB10